jgi:hypothetical protein
MPKSQTKTPTEKAQIALEKADQRLASQKARLEKITAKASTLREKLDALKAEHDLIAGEVAFSQRSRDLLASHPLLAGTATVAQDALPEADAVSFVVPAQEDAEIAGQTSIEDFTTDEPAPAAGASGIQVRENENKRPGVFAAVPDFDGDAEPGVETADDTDPDAPFEL